MSTCLSLLVALVAFVLAWMLSLTHTQPCLGVERITLPLLTTTVNACDYYGDSYTQQRDRFRRAAAGIPNATVTSLLVFKDDHGMEYVMDICVVPGSQPGLLIHSSGVHGVEGYAGSAIQLALLKALGEKTIQLHPTVIFVHAVNPFGMANYRRANENNVDLNRNALTKQEFELVANHANHENYQQFNELFNPQSVPTIWSSYVAFVLRALKELYIHGMAALKPAMVGGQYYNARGIFYGGNKLERSTELLYEWIQTYLAEKHDPAHAITWIDVHTGLGPSGRDTLLPGGSPGDDKVGLFANELQRWFPDSFNPLENTVAQGYGQVRGLYGNYFEQILFQYAHNALFLVQEFGTIPSILVGHALMTENAAYQFSDDALSWAKRTMRPAFYLQRSNWRRLVLQQGVRVALQSMQRSTFYSSMSEDDTMTES